MRDNTPQKRNSLGQFKPKPRRSQAPSAGPAVPANSARNISELIREKAKTATNGRDLMYYQREVRRFETALRKTWNPGKLFFRALERRGLEETYGPIDWKK